MPTENTGEGDINRVPQAPEENLLRSRLLGIVDSAMDAIITIDGDQLIRMFNPAAEAMFGYAADKVLGGPIDVLIPARFRAAHHGHVDGFGQTKHTNRRMGSLGAIHGLRANGREFPVEASISQVECEGQRLFTVILRDITEREEARVELLTSQAALLEAHDTLEKRVQRRTEELALAKEEAERANRAKSDFLSRMSHELRTPMNSILGFAQIMDMHATEGKDRQRIGHILKAGNHLLQLINEVLDLSRVESGQMSLSPEPVPVDSVVSMAMDWIRPLATQRGLLLESDVNGCAGLYVAADQQRLAQVLLNLLSNATKYNRSGGSIRLSCTREEGNSIRFSVTDTGPGLAPELLPRLFCPFDRLGLETGHEEGTGLGLALSKGIAEALGGSVGARSEVGKGSTFWVQLPECAPTTNAQVPPGVTETFKGVTSAFTLLYIEDNLANLRLIEALLEELPHLKLLSAMQGQLGLDLAFRHRPQLVLLDLHLPDITGEEVMRRLREHEATCDVPVVVITADATSAQRKRLLDAGAAAYLTKPLDVPCFFQVLNNLVTRGEAGPTPHRNPNAP